MQPKLSVGEFPIGPNLKYLGWVLNSLFQGIMIASPFASQCHFIFYLNWLYYRLMGMKLPLTTLVGMNATIRQPELIEVGENSILGLGCTISCHYSPSGKTHVQKRVKIGSRSVVGGFSIITPGVVIGDHSVVGTNSRIYPDVIIGNNVKIGAECSIKFGTIIPDNVKIKSNTIIEKDHQIKSGETWGGSPARLISEDGQKE
ncbi:transferase hexapeptide repeat protein [Bacteriovorax sp. Seq25_V]|nr:transferase hexapeptide repeat protein [Bacteriovorax sp. Seq25_V]